MVQWLRLSAFTAMGLGSIPGQGTKISQDRQHGRKKKRLYQKSEEAIYGMRKNICKSYTRNEEPEYVFLTPSTQQQQKKQRMQFKNG